MAASRCELRSIAQDAHVALVLSDKPLSYIGRGAVLLLPPPGQ